MTERRVTNDKTGGAKGTKPEQFHTIPIQALLELARVYGMGAEKYSPYNFHLGYEWSLSFNALMRHALAFWDGETNDPESGANHMAHVAWHALNLAFYSMNEAYAELDDRPDGPLGLVAEQSPYEAPPSPWEDYDDYGPNPDENYIMFSFREPNGGF